MLEVIKLFTTDKNKKNRSNVEKEVGHFTNCCSGVATSKKKESKAQ